MFVPAEQKNGLPEILTARFTLVCYEKFERIETSQFLNCFTKHVFYRESIEIVTSISWAMAESQPDQAQTAA